MSDFCDFIGYIVYNNKTAKEACCACNGFHAYEIPSAFPSNMPSSKKYSWQKIGNDIDGEAADDYSGYSVSLSSDGHTVAIGATDNDGNGNYSGHVRIFQWIESTSIWTQVGDDIDGEVADDHSGWSVSLSSDGRVVAIGAPWNDGNGDTSGHVRIYQSE